MDVFKSILSERGLPKKRGKVQGINRSSDPKDEAGGDGARWKGRKGEGSGGGGGPDGSPGGKGEEGGTRDTKPNVNRKKPDGDGSKPKPEGPKPEEPKPEEPKPEEPKPDDADEGGSSTPSDESEPDDLVFDEALKTALNNATINLPIPKLYQNTGKFDYLKSFRAKDIKKRNEINGGPPARRTKKKATGKWDESRLKAAAEEFEKTHRPSPMIPLLGSPNGRTFTQGAIGSSYASIIKNIGNFPNSKPLPKSDASENDLRFAYQLLVSMTWHCPSIVEDKKLKYSCVDDNRNFIDDASNPRASSFVEQVENEVRWALEYRKSIESAERQSAQMLELFRKLLQGDKSSENMVSMSLKVFWMLPATIHYLENYQRSNPSAGLSKKSGDTFVPTEVSKDIIKEFVTRAAAIDDRYGELYNLAKDFHENPDNYTGEKRQEAENAKYTIEVFDSQWREHVKNFVGRNFLYTPPNDERGIKIMGSAFRMAPINSDGLSYYFRNSGIFKDTSLTLEQSLMPNIYDKFSGNEKSNQIEAERKKMEDAEKVAPAAPTQDTTKENNYMTKNDIKKLIKEAFGEVDSIYGSYRSSRHHLQEPSEDVLDDKQKNLSQWKHFCDTMSNDTTKMQAVQFCKILIKDTELLQDILEIIAQKPELAVIIMNKMLENDGPLQ